MFVKSDYERFFPFDSIREEQCKAIEFVLDAFENRHKRFAILELGVGCGKSAVGITVAQYTNSLASPKTEDYNSGAYILTTQKVLQSQYLNDFGPLKRNLIRSIKSSSNYSCLHYTDQNCGESRRILSKLRKQLTGTDFHTCCTTRCPYAIEKQQFLNSSLGITNFSYFLAETMYAGKIEPRELLIIDECHNIEAEIGKMVEVTFSIKFARDVLKCPPPKSDKDEAVIKWVTKTYKPAVTKHIAGLEKALESRFNSGMKGFGDFSKQYEMLDKHICKVNRFINAYNPDNWIMNVVQPDTNSKRAARRFEFKPIDVAPYSHDMLFRFGDKVLMMSATVVDKDVFCKSIGVDPNEVAYLRIDSPFPIENRRVHYVPVGSMSKDNIEKSLPVMAEAIKIILEEHKNEKGIIHGVTYRISQFIFDNVKSDRFLIHSTNDRDAVLREHMKSSRPTVLISPSMMEGVDLVDDASRFQILCKVPFPYLGDKVTQKRMARDKSWYDYKTVKSVIQAMGRSVRNKDDHAMSYILDADWERFYRKNRNMFPGDFRKQLL